MSIILEIGLGFILIVFVVHIIVGLIIDESGNRRPLTKNLAEMKGGKFLWLCCLGYLSGIVVCGFIFGGIGRGPSSIRLVLNLSFVFITVVVGHSKLRRDARPYRRAGSNAAALTGIGSGAVRIVRLADVDRVEWSEEIQKNLRRVADCGLAGDREIAITLKPMWRNLSSKHGQVIEAHASLSAPVTAASGPGGEAEAVGYIGRLPHQLTNDFMAWLDSGLKPSATLEAVYDIWWSGMLGAELAIAVPEKDSERPEGCAASR